MPASQIVNESEVLRWLDEGRTDRWMCEEYERRYNVAVDPCLWDDYRRRKGLVRRGPQDDELIPWAIEPQHRWAYAVSMLRAEARKRAGAPLPDHDASRLASWLDNLAEGDLVVHYEPATPEGFHYVERRPGVDTDLVREPD